MRRIIRTLAILLLLALGIGRYVRNKIPAANVKAPTTRYPATPMLPQVIREAKKITVLISVEDWGGWERGTGVLLDATHVLTCEHVAKNEGNMMLVYFYPGYVLAHGHMVYSDASKDLAIVEIDVPVYADHYAEFTTAHYDGEPIVAVGNALGGLQWFVNYGIVSGSNRRDLFSDNLIFPGDSGGPWIDYEGNIVAISAWGLNDGSRIDGGIASQTVYDFLTAYVKSLPVKK